MTNQGQVPEKLKFFLSYRRDDRVADLTVGRIYDKITDHFGDGHAFMDVDSIGPGINFREALEEAGGEADILLVIIGDRWTKIMQERGNNPCDFVRMEIEFAFERRIPVVPVLIGGAQMPNEGDLPVSIQPLLERNARNVDPKRNFNRDMSELVAELELIYSQFSSEKRLAIFVSDLGFVNMLRDCFRNNFDRTEYLPENANWNWFFSTMASALQSKTFRVYWYSIAKFEFFPADDVKEMSFDWSVRQLKRSRFYKDKINNCSSFKARKNLVKQYKEKVEENRVKMKERLNEWHEKQERISDSCPNVSIYRTGTQFCSLVDSRLGPQKGVKEAISADLVAKSKNFDIALLIAGLDFVPPLRSLSSHGKELASLNILKTNAPISPRISRASNIESDYVLDINLEELSKFMGIDLS